MRANEFLNETELNELIAPTVGRNDQQITINIPMSLLSQREGTNEEREEEQDEDVEVIAVPVDQDPGEVEVSEPTEPEGDNEISDLVRLAGVDSQDRAEGPNHTIASPASDVVPDEPVFISPLQQQLELQKQQNGKESPVINQIINHTLLGSTAGEQPEQSVYHDNPLKNNEFVGASTGSVDNLQNATTTKGADKPWYKL